MALEHTRRILSRYVLWISSTIATRLYFEHVNNYSRSYGPLNGVVMLLLWLYVSDGTVLHQPRHRLGDRKEYKGVTRQIRRPASGSFEIRESAPGGEESA